MSYIAAFDFTFGDKLYKRGVFLPDEFANLAGAKLVDKVEISKTKEILIPKEVPKIIPKVEIKKDGRGRPRKG